MLTRWQKLQAYEIARVFAEEGVIFGQELEEYMSLDEENNLFTLKDTEKEEFVDEVFNAVENIWNKVLVITDTEENKTKIFYGVEEAAKYLNVVIRAIYSAKCRKSKVKRRYLVSSYKPTAKELVLGINNIEMNGENYEN